MYRIAFLSLLLSVSFHQLSLFGQLLEAEEDSRVDLLQMLSLQIKGNMDRIDSWEANFSIAEASRRTDPPIPKPNSSTSNVQRLRGKYIYKSAAQGRFVLDRRLDSLYTEYTRAGNKILYEHVETGEKHYFDNRAYSRKSILTPEHYLSHNPEQKVVGIGGPDDPTGRQAARGITYRKSNASGKRLRVNSVVIDPRQICTLGQNPFDDYFAGMAELLTKKPQLLLDIEATADGSKGYQYTYLSPSGDLLNVTLSESNFYMPVREKATAGDGSYDETVEWSYQEVDGIKVPKRYHRKLLLEGELAIEREIVFTDTFLNRTVPEDTFSYSQFQPDDGDRLVDELDNNESLIFDNGNAILQSDYLEGLGIATPLNPQPSNRVAFIIANALAILLIVFLINRTRRSRISNS